MNSGADNSGYSSPPSGLQHGWLKEAQTVRRLTSINVLNINCNGGNLFLKGRSSFYSVKETRIALQWLRGALL